MRVRVTAAFALFIAGWLWIDARAQTNAPIVSGAHRFEKVTDGVYYATASGTMTVGANSPIIVTDTEAIVIDSEITPAAARALIADIKAITDKPVQVRDRFPLSLRSRVRQPGVRSRCAGDRSREYAQAPADQRPRAVHLSGQPQSPAGGDAAAADRGGEGSGAEGAARAGAGEPVGVSGPGQGNQGHATDGDARQEDDALSRRPRNPAAVLRSRPYRHRRRRLPAQRKDRLHRRPDGVGRLVHGRCLRRRVVGDARSPVDARLRHRAAWSRRGVQGQGAHPGVSALRQLALEADAGPEEAGCGSRCGCAARST